MKYLYIIIITLSTLSTSCSKSIYYEYSTSGDYCSVEVSPKNELTIYLSDTTVSNPNKRKVDLICLYCKSKNNTISRKENISISFALYECKYLKIYKDGEISRAKIPRADLYNFNIEDVFSYYGNSFSNIQTDREDETRESFSTNAIYEKTGIVTLPPIMTRVDSISYLNFPLSTRKYDLKKMVKKLKSYED